MEQRIYHGNVSPEGLADFLMQRYDPRDDLQAQKIGQGDSLVVQIGQGDVPKKSSTPSPSASLARSTPSRA